MRSQLLLVVSSRRRRLACSPRSPPSSSSSSETEEPERPVSRPSLCAAMGPSRSLARLYADVRVRWVRSPPFLSFRQATLDRRYVRARRPVHRPSVTVKLTVCPCALPPCRVREEGGHQQRLSCRQTGARLLSSSLPLADPVSCRLSLRTTVLSLSTSVSSESDMRRIFCEAVVADGCALGRWAVCGRADISRPGRVLQPRSESRSTPSSSRPTLEPSASTFGTPPDRRSSVSELIALSAHFLDSADAVESSSPCPTLADLETDGGAAVFSLSVALRWTA